MQFYYTGSITYLGTQNDPSQSLGGFISATLVPNDQLNNLFSDLSWQTVVSKRPETRGLILKNTLGTDAIGVTFGYIYPANPTFKIEVAFVTLNPSNPQVIEKIPNSQASPYAATFTEANIDPSHSIDNSVSIGDLLNGASIGLWLRRTPVSVFTPPTFGTDDTSIQAEIAFWQGISDPKRSPLQQVQIKMNYQINQ